MRADESRSRVIAKTLRPTMSQAEAILWSRLRERDVAGARFRRQHPIGPYVTDFACIQHKLVVEVDGATHSSDQELAYDATHTIYLKGRGWRVLRVSNEDVYRRLADVLETIRRHIPPPSRRHRSRHAGRTPPP